MSRQRIFGVYKRHYYATTRSFPRILDTLLWPFVDLALWGLVTTYLQDQDVHVATPLTFLLGGLVLWDIVFRTKNQVAVTFLEELWSRNVIGILASPLTPAEYLTGAVLWGLTTVAVAWALIAVFAWILFSFGVTVLGVSLVAFGAALVVFGVALALVVLGLVFRFGWGAEIMAWALAMMVLPFSAVYYPLATLPGWAQTVSSALPTSHIFEAMRAILAGAPAQWRELAVAFGLDAVYLVGAFAFARWMFATLRRRGYVTKFI
jgi:ABC-2 type transport system permease protein